MTGHPTPEAAVRAGDAPVPERYARIVLVSRSPDDQHAVVLMAYNEPPHIEPYVILCSRDDDGWEEGHGASAGGVNWMWIRDDPDHGPVGVQTTWDPPTVTWDVPSRAHPDDWSPDDGPPAGMDRW